MPGGSSGEKIEATGLEQNWKKDYAKEMHTQHTYIYTENELWHCL